MKVRKTERYRQQSWSFFQLRSFIAYKRQDAGVPVIGSIPGIRVKPAMFAANVVIEMDCSFEMQTTVISTRTLTPRSSSPWLGLVYYPGTEEAHTNPTRERGECLSALACALG